MCVIYDAGGNYYGSYTADDANWQNLSYSGTVPSGATTAHLQVRFYDVSAGWNGQANVLIDHASLTLNGGSNLLPNADFESWPPSTDTQPPVWTAGYPMTVVRDDKAIVRVNMDEPGTAYAIAVPAGATAPTSQEVKAGADYNGVTVVSGGSVQIANANEEYIFVLNGLTPSTAYDIWVVAEDDEATPNLQSDPVKFSVTTTALRSLTMTSPKDKDTLAIGGVLHFEWTAENIDSLYMGVYVYQHDADFIISDDNDQPIVLDASLGSYDFTIPHDADSGYYMISLMDAADTSFHVSADSVFLRDERVLEWISPQDGETYYVGDTVVFKWHSEYVDSVYIGGYVYSDSSWFLLPDTENPIAFPADMDSLVFPIPLDASVDSVRLILYDAADTSLQDVADPVYILDTIKPQIALLMPENGKTDVPYTFMAVLAFTEEVNPLGGNIYLHAEDGTVLETYGVDTLDHDYSAFAIPVHSPLAKGAVYYFTMDSGAVEDNQHNKFGGISDPDTWRFTTAEKQLYISEYIEGSSNNKALEIYNPTDHTVDLSQYGMLSSYNGKGWDYPPYTLHGQLGPGEVYTIVNPNFDFSMLADSAAVVDTLIGQYLTWFNGDDARGLIQLVGGSWEEFPNFTLIDLIGDPDNDPGSGWDVAGVTTATKDHTLIRKANVETGNITIGWEASAGTDAENSEWIVMPQNFVDNLGYPSPTGSDRTDITAMKLEDVDGNLVSKTVTIDSAAATIDIEVIYGASTHVDSLVPVITAAPGATTVPATGDTVDFTNPVPVTVTAEDGLATRVWTVTVTVAAAPSSDAGIITFGIDGQTGEAVIDTVNHTVSVEMPFGTDVTALAPTLEVSAGATVVPASGEPQDFSNPVTYTVTAEDGTTTVEWTVTVSVFEPPVVSIYEIQYTTDASGDSPYLGQMVRTSGIVTAVNIYQGAFKGYFLQDTAAAWNGVYVYDPDHDAVQLGDSVTLVGMVDEFYGLTEVKNIKDLVVVSSGNTLPGPVELATGEASAEKWEGVYVMFSNATCIDNNLGHGEVSVDDGSGEVIVDDFLYQYDPAADFVVNNIYNLTGVMNFSYGKFKLNPRSADDISDVTGIDRNSLENNIRIYPNPSTGMVYLTIDGMEGENLKVTVLNTQGKVVYTKKFTNSSLSREQIDLTGISKGLFFIRVENGDRTVVKRIVIQ